jgi:hypothetical protein
MARSQDYAAHPDARTATDSVLTAGDDDVRPLSAAAHFCVARPPKLVFAGA